MTFDLEKARDAAKFDDRMAITMFPLAIAEIERLRSEKTFLEKVVHIKNTRLKELEDAHKRSGAKYAKIINELRSSVYANIPGLKEGKIGPDAKPRSWQITEERRGAIDRGLQFLEWSYAKNSALDTKEQITVLWAMLDEAGQWGSKCASQNALSGPGDQ